MIEKTGEPPGRGSGFECNRRTVLGGLLAAFLTTTPGILPGGHSGVAMAQQPPVAALPIPRVNHTISLMGDGSVIVAGGYYLGALASVQRYNLANASWSDTGDLLIPRSAHAAATLPTGQLLVCGGSYLGLLAAVELYDPTTGLWTMGPSMNTPRAGHAALSINGGVLVYGGANAGDLASAEFFDGMNWSLVS